MSSFLHGMISTGSIRHSATEAQLPMSLVFAPPGHYDIGEGAANACTRQSVIPIAPSYILHQRNHKEHSLIYKGAWHHSNEWILYLCTCTMLHIWVEKTGSSAHPHPPRGYHFKWGLGLPSTHLLEGSHRLHSPVRKCWLQWKADWLLQTASSPFTNVLVTVQGWGAYALWTAQSFYSGTLFGSATSALS